MKLKNSDTNQFPHSYGGNQPNTNQQESTKQYQLDEFPNGHIPTPQNNQNQNYNHYNN